MNITLNINKKYYCAKKIKSSGFTMLMRMVMKTKKYENYDALISYIENNKNEINKKNNYGMTALMLACINSNYKSTEKTVKILIDAGCDLNCQSIRGLTAVMYAVMFSAITSTMNTIQMLVSSKCNLFLRTTEYWDITMLCARICKNEDIFKILIDSGCNLKYVNSNGHSTIYLAARYRENVKIIKLLIDSGCDLNWCDDKLNSILMTVIQYNNNCEQIAELLIDMGCDISNKNIHGMTAMDFAIRKRSVNIIKKIINTKCGNIFDGKEFLFAVEYNHEDIVRLLINDDSYKSQKIFIHAIHFGHENIIKLLIDNDYDINSKNEDVLDSALITAIRLGYYSIAKLLINCGCDLDTMNIYNYNALMLCRDTEITKLLINKGCHINNNQIIQITRNTDDINLSFKLTCLVECGIRKYIKKTYYLNVIRHIPQYAKEFKLKYGTVFQKIIIYNIKLRFTSNSDIFHEIKLYDPIILHYLDIHSVDQIDKLGKCVDFE